MSLRIPVRTATAAVLTALAVLSGCQYAGPADDPVSRSLTWFSYVGGEDIRKACGPGSGDVYRFVYNGLSDVQVRSYDIRPLPGGRGASVTAFANPEPNLFRPGQVVEQYNGVTAQSTMTPQGLADLRAALGADRFEAFKPAGLRLPSDEFYWTAVACVDGRFHANAWLYPTERFKELRFPKVLFAYDKTGVEVYEARVDYLRPDDPNRLRTRGPSGPYRIELGPDGFVGMKGFF